jgi:threonine/homoserine/homoserine lactone efflux protein
MINEYLNAILLGFGLAFMVGPVFFVLLETSVVKGIRAAIVFDFGVVLSDALFIFIAYYGSRTFLVKLKDDPRLFLIGGIILISYGLYTVFYKKTKKTVTDSELVVVENNNYLGLFLKGFFLNSINIGVLAFWLAIVIAISSGLQMNENKIFNYFVVVISTLLITDLVKITAAKQLKKQLTPVVLRKIRQTIGIFFIIFGVILATKKYIPEQTIQMFDKVIEKVK